MSKSLLVMPYAGDAFPGAKTFVQDRTIWGAAPAGLSTGLRQEKKIAGGASPQKAALSAPRAVAQRVERAAAQVLAGGVQARAAEVGAGHDERLVVAVHVAQVVRVAHVAQEGVVRDVVGGARDDVPLGGVARPAVLGGRVAADAGGAVLGAVLRGAARQREARERHDGVERVPVAGEERVEAEARLGGVHRGAAHVGAAGAAGAVPHVVAHAGVGVEPRQARVGGGAAGRARGARAAAVLRGALARVPGAEREVEARRRLVDRAGHAVRAGALQVAVVVVPAVVAGVAVVQRRGLV